MYKPSKFNILKQTEEGENYLINTRTTAILNVSNDPLASLKDYLTNGSHFSDEKLDQKSLQFLSESGFLVPESFDEMKWMEEIHWNARKGEKAFALAVVLTLACNFRCVYCYEDHVNISMDDRMSDQIIKLISRNLVGKENLHIAWFGGEPLLCIDRIELMTQQIFKLVNHRAINYSARISTNGYLLSPRVAKILQDCRVTDVQITLDGPPDVHDSRRFLVGGLSTFDQIYENIGTSIGLFNRLTIRVNIDKRNFESIPSLLENYLYPFREGIFLTFSAAMSPKCVDQIETWTIPPEEFWAVEKRLGSLADNLGFKVMRGYPIPCTSFCNAYQSNTYLIDPYGLVNRCTKYLGHKSEYYGRLMSDGTIETNQNSVQALWGQWTPFNDSECLFCKVLPLCMGGCLLYLSSSKPKELTHRCFAKTDIVNSLLREKLFKQLVDSGKTSR